LLAQVFINPSTSDVVATTTAEALAMGKWAVVPDIACNAFFKQFRNCLTYKDAAGFIEAVDRALQKEPAPLSDSELRYECLLNCGEGEGRGMSCIAK
jgi:digalactosyldiacylglycerol synthase